MGKLYFRAGLDAYRITGKPPQSTGYPVPYSERPAIWGKRSLPSASTFPYSFLTTLNLKFYDADNKENDKSAERYQNQPKIEAGKDLGQEDRMAINKAEPSGRSVSADDKGKDSRHRPARGRMAVTHLHREAWAQEAVNGTNSDCLTIGAGRCGTCLKPLLPGTGKKFCCSRCRLMAWACRQIVRDYEAGRLPGLEDEIARLK